MAKKVQKRVVKRKAPVRVPTMDTVQEEKLKIMVMGVGGSGKNVTNHMIKQGISGVDFVVANTDSQDLKQSKTSKRIHLGKQATKGLGTGMNPALGRSAAEEVKGEISDLVKDASILFIAGGMGGGTGTGASPVIAKIAKDSGVLTVAVVTKPFFFEGGQRAVIADDGIKELRKYTDAIVIIPNDKILEMADKKTNAQEAFQMSDDILLKAVKGISDVLTRPGDINIDFADIKAIIEDADDAIMGVGKARGANRAEMATDKAMSSVMLEDGMSIDGAKRIMFSIASKNRKDLAMEEIKNIAERITATAAKDSKVIFGTSTDRDLKEGEIRVTVVATSFNEKDAPLTKKTPFFGGASEEKKEEKDYEEVDVEEYFDDYIEDAENNDDEDTGMKFKNWNIWKK